MKIYIVHPRECQAAMTRVDRKTGACETFQHDTPDKAWQHRLSMRMGMSDDLLNPAAYVIVAAHSTGQVTEHGVDEFVEDWSDVVDPQSLPSVIAAARTSFNIVGVTRHDVGMETFYCSTIDDAAIFEDVCVEVRALIESAAALKFASYVFDVGGVDDSRPLEIIVSTAPTAKIANTWSVRQEVEIRHKVKVGGAISINHEAFELE